MTDHTTLTPRSRHGSDGSGWSVAGAPAAVRVAFAAPKANVAGIGAGAAAGNIASVYGPSVSIAA
ncbi:hypothetical protein [Halobaculum gomorrense]|uniref:Pyruvate carboxyltransferase domain-containing protein n=1 Tax=Halobaculum gomorrense TaxID=43928 RepID=A0A1M5M403_9EURY|nr:hypothetical protein [Halobaculum gomorrense]SHG71988.1 hypothetical protein SAMN05443636_0876 [Halobaculum gomorrense]